MIEKLESHYVLAIQASIEAGFAIMDVFHSKDFGVELKSDSSPVTKADLASSEIITEMLLSTKIPIISEEGDLGSYESRKNWDLLWIVDPLDGTKEFIKKTNEFAVSIGLVQNGKPIFGVIYIPTSQEVFFGNSELGSYKFNYTKDKEVSAQIEKSISLPVTKTPEDVLVITGGKRTEAAFYQDSGLMEDYSYTETTFKKLSSAIKFCRIAEGKMDIYPRDYPCMEWDTAAGQAIVNGIGKELYSIETQEVIQYNQEDLYVPFFLLK